MNAPLVTVGMPVRNGGAMFAAALEAVLSQTLADIEVLISDNASDDGTAAIAAAAAARDPRVRYVRQPVLLRAFDNMFGLLDHARGRYFVWAAHDDLRSPDYLERLVAGFDREDVVLCFGELEIMPVHGRPGSRHTGYDFETSADTSRMVRMRKQALMQCYHFYGVWRTATLRGLPRIHAPWWGDLPLMLAAAVAGRFRYVPGPVFRYYEIPKTDAERSAYQDNRTERVSRVAYVLALIAASARSVAAVSNWPLACVAAGFVAEKNLRFAATGLRRRLARLLAGRTTARPQN